MSSTDWLFVALFLAITLVTVFLWPAPGAEPAPAAREPSKPPPAPPVSLGELPKIDYEEDAEVDPTKVGGKDPVRDVSAVAMAIVFDEDAATDEPTKASPLILVSATAQTDKGLRRKANEDSLLVDQGNALYVVADGMGGYRGGQIASALAVETIAKAFAASSFDGERHDNLPRQASELARAIQMANTAILEHAEKEKSLKGMGTTICAARFSPNKQRLYIGHVGDSRVYRWRRGLLKQMTADHTMRDHGLTGAQGAQLSRAVGVWPLVPIDLLLAKPEADDVYLLCSDGLSKMVKNDEIAKVLAAESKPAAAVEKLIERANANGGLDNITAILVRVSAPISAPPAA
jgi:protein phosphatase